MTIMSSAAPAAPPPAAPAADPATNNQPAPAAPESQPAAAPPAAPPAPPSYDPALYGKADEKTGRPEKVAAKYWDAEKREIRIGAVFDQLNWLQGKLGDKREKPPKEYTLEPSDGWQPPAEMAKDPVYAAVSSWARDNGELSNAQFNGLVRQFAQAQEASQKEILQAELATIGKDYEARIEKVGTWLQATVSPESFQSLYDGIQTAGAFLAIEELMQTTLPPSLEAGGEVPTGDTLESVDLAWNAKNEHGQRKVEIDPKYREEVRRRRAEVLKRRPVRR